MKCKACGSTRILFDPFRGEYFCADCGLVQDMEFIPPKPNGESTPTLFLGSFTEFKNPRLRRLYQKILADVTRRGNGGYQKERAFAIAEIFRMNAALHLPRLVRYQSVQIYEYITANTTVLRDKRITIESLATASIMLAMQILGVNRAFEEIANASKATPKSILVSFEKVKREWENRGRERPNYSKAGVHAPFEKNRGG